MPTFRVKMLVLNHCETYWADNIGKTREIVQLFAGCVDAEDAKAKAKQVYAVSKFKSVEPVKEKKK